MSTFVVRFHRAGPRHLSGEVRHVGTGESLRFVSAEQLLRFFEELNATALPPGEGAFEPSAPPTAEGPPPRADSPAGRAQAKSGRRARRPARPK